MAKAFENSKELYIYPAVFTYDESGISIEFPDLPGCLSCADTDEEAVFCAKEVLALTLYGMEEDGEKIPEPSPVSGISVNQNQRLISIDVWMPYYRAKIETHCVKKTLTIPNWLNVIAEENKVNFSQILQNSLIEYLGIKKRD